eukprot:CAMPEP_0170615428 /NCGR_PEP_ID=MMETSP0224-20130122/25329_1 /TAXON_ID=285029 /ORGANISM="Togula jolla, Strain CCCM 725" /LENGTH=67 /DNA_ID=CAMNT_0010941153 /DNA_START=575 /DNA_END=778 /DNA_ORIENTATION=+
MAAVLVRPPSRELEDEACWDNPAQSTAEERVNMKVQMKSVTCKKTPEQNAIGASRRDRYQGHCDEKL